MSLILGPDGTPITSESRTQDATSPATLRGADLQLAYPGVRDAWGEGVNDPAVRNGWTYAGANGQALPVGQYGLIRELERRRCRAAYFQNALFRGAVQIIAAFLSGDAFSYADPDDKTAALALEEFWQANSLGELFGERWLIEYLLDGENATLFPEQDAGPDLPSRVAFLDVDRTFRLESSTAFGTVASDMVQGIHVSTGPGVEEPYPLGRFTWTANDALWNDPRGWPVAMGAVDPALAYIGLLNHRLNVHGLQSRVLGVYKAALNPAGTDANGTPDGGVHQWRMKTGAFRQLPAQGGIVPLVVKPGYTDQNGNRYDGFSEELDFPKPASGASDASTDQRAFLRLVGLAMGGLPEHWLGEGGNVNRACYSADTETLTVEGWRTYEQITPDTLIAQFNPDSAVVEWVKAGPLYQYDYRGPMYHFHNAHLDILVTPDHRMWVKRDRNDKTQRTYEIVKSQDIAVNNWYFSHHLTSDGDELTHWTLPAQTHGNGKHVYPELDLPADAFIEFLGYFLSEGCANVYNQRYHISLAQKKPDSTARIRACLARLPSLKWGEYTDAQGTVRWQCNDKRLCLWLLEHCRRLAENKEFPEFLHHLCLRQSAILFAALMDGDGTRDKRPNRISGAYYSKSPTLIDDVQRLALKLGHSAKVIDVRGRTRVFRLLLQFGKPEHRLNAADVEQVPYVGKVFCFSVPSGLFVTRRNGKVAIQGNTAGEMGTPAVRLALRRQGTGRGYLDRLIRTELKRRFGRERLYTVYRTTYKADGLTRVRRRLRVPADLLEISWQFPSLTEETLDTLIRRALAADARGWASPQTLAGSLGFDPAGEAERMAAVGLTFGQARQLPVTPGGGDLNEPTPTIPPARTGE
ncbi:LAGLIDADG family homing endonuclease [Deinococcus peraridilitoris]|uniref:DOD-type homing endonuclease domain-containing protein n=1 Tax=Deinococcus peraridilitoris (strain DSM 19664 / LMG 22246 / CIP 109416 / KR-200) TaxID=937777 RepID=L0A1N6_DEIPD|nr:LAGLIDADG family homing endonuclease [Deinococcus peraridilitoris]AFZ67082.1 hypothetical protein Deipe_1541 [Deinococcus peraridilitoris DSM 19664]